MGDSVDYGPSYFKIPWSEYPMTPNVRDYSTAELERLTTLNLTTCKPGEVAYVYGFTATEAKLRLADGRVAASNGEVFTPGDSGAPCRRVTSFTDPTDLDPPQSEMLAELERRKSLCLNNATHTGRTIRYYGRHYLVLDVCTARKLADTDTLVTVQLDGALKGYVSLFAMPDPDITLLP